jgi:hypothetical protein
MTTRSIKALLALTLVVSVSLLLPTRTEACGPFFVDAIFIFTKHPDFPLENYTAGKLGVINPRWARSYLVVAYRTLAGAPLSDGEAKAVKSLWDDRLNLNDNYDDSGTKKWIEARKKVAGAAVIADVQTYRNREKPHEYEEFLNCQQDAFQTATATLEERIQKFGAASSQVKEWLAAQDIVFGNCREGNRIPDATRDQDALVRADRVYQIAAANFYATNFDQAKEQFDAIAKDKDSPYRIVAPYLAARALLRKGSFAEKEEDGRPFLADAETRLGAILKDNALKLMHHGAMRLLNLTRVRLHPEEKLHELAQEISRKDSSADFKQAVWDYTVLLDKYLEVEDEEAKKKQIPSSLSSDDLSDWIITIEADRDDAAAHAIDRWQKTKSATWLVAALTTATGHQGNLDDLLRAAAAIDHSSPAFPSVVFHQARLLMEANRGAEARALLDKVLTNERTRISPSATNSLLSIRMLLAQNVEEFLTSSQRIPAAFSEDSDGREIPEDPKEAEQTANGSKYFFDIDAANVFNKAMPVATMKDAALSKTLAPNLRRDVAQAAFLRAALLDDRATAMAAAPVLNELYPQAKEFVVAYERAATPDARRFAAAFLSLKNPGLRPFVSAGIGRTTAVDDIDSYRDNYWTTEPPAPVGGPFEESTKPKEVVVPEFLKSSQATAEKQFAGIQALGTAPNFLCRVAIDWATNNPADPRAPEALHLAVRSTRYGSTDQETGKWSKAAFDLLHRKYPNTVWARNTKYWFKG